MQSQRMPIKTIFYVCMSCSNSIRKIDAVITHVMRCPNKVENHAHKSLHNQLKRWVVLVNNFNCTELLRNRSWGISNYIIQLHHHWFTFSVIQCIVFCEFASTVPNWYDACFNIINWAAQNSCNTFEGLLPMRPIHFGRCSNVWHPAAFRACEQKKTD